ncbi:hypothetical protein POVWA2_049550 [Plasmodium ovale wallikeri]|uniref:Uncharacterized protein n=1 Tax=Plasmodium ovale wallikeri TaxID=864142 RepID=A0A1A8ZM25_PLAOA|nr:hypothetical protein POVWA1_050850 [Plasmodium ovale wallikeri]SBT45228.1 hypothetical protein POVWA2_049550 [Plasmodium ovale wallikeri]
MLMGSQLQCTLTTKKKKSRLFHEGDVKRSQHQRGHNGSITNTNNNNVVIVTPTGSNAKMGVKKEQSLFAHHTYASPYNEYSSTFGFMCYANSALSHT